MLKQLKKQRVYSFYNSALYVPKKTDKPSFTIFITWYLIGLAAGAACSKLNG
jgi:hypothetical protein